MNQEIYEKLREMRLPIMAEEYKDQSENTDTQNMTFEERLEAMVIKEYDSQINHTVKRYIKNANFYDSNAFGGNACMERYRVQYIRLPDLFQEIEEAKIQGHYKKYMKKLSKVDLLILDEFLLTNISEGERNDLFEVIQSRTDNKSTIYCSQWAPEGWLGKLGNGPLADAILDRIRNSSYTILLKGRSLREDYSKIK